MPTFDKTKIAALTEKFPSTYMESVFGSRDNQKALKSYMSSFDSSKIADLDEFHTKVTTILTKITLLTKENQAQFQAFTQAAKTVVAEIKAYKEACREEIRAKIAPVLESTSAVTSPLSLPSQQNQELLTRLKKNDKFMQSRH